MEEVCCDVVRMYANAQRYNPPGSPIATDARKLLGIFESILAYLFALNDAARDAHNDATSTTPTMITTTTPTHHVSGVAWSCSARCSLCSS